MQESKYFQEQETEESRWEKILSGVEKYISGSFLGLSCLLVFAAVVMRYFFGYSSSIIEESVRYLVIWSVFVAGSLALKNNVHITIDILTIRLSDKKRIILQSFAYFTGIFYCAILAYKGFQLAYNAYWVGETTTSAWHLPMVIPKMAVPVGAFLLIIRFAQKFVQNIKFLRDKNPRRGVDAL